MAEVSTLVNATGTNGVSTVLAIRFKVTGWRNYAIEWR